MWNYLGVMLLAVAASQGGIFGLLYLMTRLEPQKVDPSTAARPAGAVTPAVRPAPSSGGPAGRPAPVLAAAPTQDPVPPSAAVA